MVKNLLLTLFLATFCLSVKAQTTFNVGNSGNTYTPATLTIQQGDIVNWAITGNHNVQEVTLGTWNVNGSAPKANGFSTPFGGGQVTFNTAGTYYYVCTPHAGVGMKGQIIVTSIASVDPEKPLVKSVEVYPNPANDQFTVKISSPEPISYRMKVVDVIGKNVGRLYQQGTVGQGQTNLSINTAQLPQGIYFVELDLDGVKSVKRLIVTH